MYRLAKQCPDLKKLDIMYYGDGTKIDTNLQYLIPFCYKLESIELSRFTLSHDHCVWLGACEQLESMKVPLSKLSAASIKALFKNKRKLKTLELTDTCHGVVLLELGTNCPLLEHLYIDYLEETTAMHIEVFTQGCPKLQSLTFGDIRDTNHSASGFKNKMINDLGKNSPLLERVVMTGENTSDISETALKSLAQGCPLLKQFELNQDSIPSTGVKHLVGHCSKLAIYLFSLQ